MRSLLPTLLAASLVACAAPRRADDLIPVRGADVRHTLQGSWEILDDDGEWAGAIHLDDDRFTADTARNRLFGSWDLVDRQGNAHSAALQVDGYDEGGVREIYGSPDRVLLRLVFVDWDRLYAIEDGAAWTEWRRLVAVPEPAADAPAADAPAADEPAAEPPESPAEVGEPEGSGADSTLGER